MADDARPAGEIVLYRTEDGRTRLECRFVDETVWLSQALMAELFQKDVRTINEHLRNIYDEGEADPDTTIRKFRIVRQEGSRQVLREIEHYSLDAILAVGYRVRSSRGTQFRIWATERLHEYLVKGFAMDDERLKSPPVEGAAVPDYFDELLERIRDIRASEARMYLRVKEIFALAADYDPARKDTVQFFPIIQNKLDEFLRFNERGVLEGAGTVSHEQAALDAQAEYERFAARRRALLEAEGERDSVRALEAAAKQLAAPQGRRAEKKKRRDG